MARKKVKIKNLKMSLEIKKLSEQSKDRRVRKMMIYGLPSSGKTTLATQLFPSRKVLLIDCENGTRYIKSQDNVDILNINKYFTNEQTVELSKMVKNYDVVVVDSIGLLQDLFSKSSLLRSNHKKEDGGLTLAGYGFMKLKIDSFLNFLYDNVDTVLVIAHQSEKSMRKEEGDTISSVIAPAVTGGMFDILLARMELVVKLRVKTIKKELTRTVMLYDDTNSFISKDRPAFFNNKKEMEVSDFIGKFVEFNK